jgi:DNA polymerase III subunit gamma/tau
MSVLEIDAASNGSVAEVRRIQELCQYGHGGEWRVVLWDEAHSMSKEAFNALLKIMEEPPPNTLFVLLTTEVNKIPGTIASRSMPFDFRRLSLDDVVGRLSEVATKEGIEVDPVLFPAIAIRAQGGMRDALMTLDQLWVSKVTTIDGYRELFGIHDAAPALFNCALTGDYGGGTSLLQTVWTRTGDLDSVVVDLTMLTADLIVLKSGGELQIMGEADKAARESLVQKVTIDKLLNATKILWQLRDRVKALGGDQLASATLGFFMLSQILHSGVAPIPTTQKVEIPSAKPAQDLSQAPVLTLDRLRELASR